MDFYNSIKNELIENEINKKVKDYSKNKYELQKYYNVGKLLIDAGAYVKERYERNNKGGFTALMYATTAEQTRLLIKAGANVNQTDCWGHSVLEHARTAEQARLLIKAGAKGKISPFLLRMESEQTS